MTTATLGLAVTSNAGTAAADLDKLTAAASRSEAAAKRVEKSFADAGGVMARINQMTGANSVFSGSRAADIAAYGRELDGLRAKFNPVFAAQQRFASVNEEIARAQRLGAISTMEATAAIAKEQAVLNSATAELRQNTQAANDNRAAHAARAGVSSGAQNFNTANVAAQFQDIAVTSAMGMSPLQIALQQGTQLSAVLGGQGLTGVVRTLGGAFASILSPVSLLTIGAVALGAAGLQALGGIFKSAESATDALERHEAWLDKILAGYGSVRDAASSALDEALKLPQESVISNLEARRRSAEEAAEVAMRKALEMDEYFRAVAGLGRANGVSDEIVTSLESVSAAISDMSSDAKLTKPELDRLHVALTELANSTADENIKAIANENLALVDAARSAKGEVSTLVDALNAMPESVSVRINLQMADFNTAITNLDELMPDFRSRFARSRDEAAAFLQDARVSATDRILQMAAEQKYSDVMAGIAEEERRYEERQGASASRAAARAAAKPGDTFASMTSTAADLINRLAEQARSAQGDFQ